jgi:Trk K+ transport system NAD-binding subunit
MSLGDMMILLLRKGEYSVVGEVDPTALAVGKRISELRCRRLHLDRRSEGRAIVPHGDTVLQRWMKCSPWFAFHNRA